MNIIKFSLVIVLLAISCNEIKTQNWCRFDGRIYDQNGRTYYINRWNYWGCSESDVWAPYGKKIMLTVSDVNVDCRSYSNIQFKDDLNQNYDFCALNSPSSFTYFTTSDTVHIFKRGRVSFTLRVDFVDSINPPTNPPVIPTNPPIVPTNPPIVPTNPPIITTNPPPSGSCGVASVKPNELGLTKIVNGIEANPHSWPWQVYITDNNYVCAATLINNQWLVTAAHCDFDISTFQAYLGDHRRGEGNTVIKVEKYIAHPSYRFDDGYDIAMLKLATPVKFSSTIQPACLPSSKYETIGKTGIVTGWGNTQENGNLAYNLQQVSITVLPDSECNSNPSTSICAGETSPIVHDSCQGDSGGPFVMKDTNSAYYLAGVVSSGEGCRGRGIYVRVSAFESWISQTIQNN